ncbi:hypothetical protein MERGE_000645 [Pneumocystis wakefieldiae]|uniref:Uncharacterized protein n=1 Tax=Pneumocystis wakefieldiae TaxID=38082 RepID=A0A899G4L4_9ASCO|nr:hypothetical protein MERGE_000645 [Pneumocystis wakefieldiae]
MAGINAFVAKKPINVAGKAIEGRQFHSFSLIFYHYSNDLREMTLKIVFMIESCFCEKNTNHLVLYRDEWSVSRSDDNLYA